jgi:predicted TIM-barrel fold metal-dependent hydrolase
LADSDTFLRAAALILCLGAHPAIAEEPPLSPFALGRIDAHVHFFAEAKPVLEVLDRLNVTGVNICVVDRYDPGYETAPPQHEMARRLARASGGRLPWIAALDDGMFASPGFARRAIADLERALGEGALGVKIYKSMGMELRRSDGAYVLPDDPVFEPIFAALARRGTTVYAHLAEPIAAWQPLDPQSPDYGYYKNNPAWYVHGRSGVPSKDTILAARDRLLEKSPRLRLVGCHLGSMEEDVDDIARRLDRYPNFAVDTAARVVHLMRQPREKVRAFLIRYQDRVLYGTDIGILPGEDAVKVARKLEERYARDWAYFATAHEVEDEGHAVTGLALPPPVLRKLFRENAVRWVPGVLTAAEKRVP